MKSHRIIVGLVLLQSLLITTVYADSAETAVANAYKNWCNTIGTAHGHAEDITKFYAPDATLLPTLSPDILFNKKEGGMHAYFVNLTSLKDIRCVPKQLITRVYGDVAINAGLYNFHYIDEKGHEKNIPARFSFAYEHKDNQWLIVNHHSSVVPK
jgi:uncharacterized protein (TIGR02246 family)